jgi:hypothetical protein
LVFSWVELAAECISWTFEWESDWKLMHMILVSWRLIAFFGNIILIQWKLVGYLVGGLEHFFPFSWDCHHPN